MLLTILEPWSSYVSSYFLLNTLGQTTARCHYLVFRSNQAGKRISRLCSIQTNSRNTAICANLIKRVLQRRNRYYSCSWSNRSFWGFRRSPSFVCPRFRRSYSGQRRRNYAKHGSYWSDWSLFGWSLRAWTFALFDIFARKMAANRWTQFLLMYLYHIWISIS